MQKVLYGQELVMFTKNPQEEKHPQNADCPVFSGFKVLLKHCYTNEEGFLC